MIKACPKIRAAVKKACVGRKVALWHTSEDKTLVAAGGLLVQRLDGNTLRSGEEACMSSRNILQPPSLLKKGVKPISTTEVATSC